MAASKQLVAEPSLAMLWLFAALIGDDALGGRGAGGFAGAAARFGGEREFGFRACDLAGAGFFARHS